MALSFVSEPIRPDTATFDPARMGRGEPGLPGAFFWRGQRIEVAALLDAWKEYGDCRHGSGERYVRRHVYRLRLADGREARVYFQRSFGRTRALSSSRWWLLDLG